MLSFEDIREWVEDGRVDDGWKYQRELCLSVVVREHNESFWRRPSTTHSVLPCIHLHLVTSLLGHCLPFVACIPLANAM